MFAWLQNVTRKINGSSLRPFLLNSPKMPAVLLETGRWTRDLCPGPGGRMFLKQVNWDLAEQVAQVDRFSFKENRHLFQGFTAMQGWGEIPETILVKQLLSFLLQNSCEMQNYPVQLFKGK